MVSDPDLGFAGLRRFGPGLTQHMALKIRSGLKATNFMLVDSPGMIDAPGGNDLGAKQERGYHFENTVRWRAGRAEMPRGTSRGDAVETLWRRVAATPRPRRGDSVETGRSDAAAATWKFRGDESPRRRGRDLEIPSRRVAAMPRLRRGDSVETRRRDAATRRRVAATPRPRRPLGTAASRRPGTASTQCLA